MAITFRGQANRLNKETKGRNQVGFQDKSAAGDRQGVGGEDVSLKQATGSFNKRNTSPAKKSCSPITARAKNSPLKMNQALVDGAANTNKEFVDVGAIVGGALNQPDKKAKGKTADLAPKAPKEKGKTLDAPKAKKIDTNLGATNPLDNMEAPTLEF